MGRELPQGRRIGNYAIEHLAARGGLYSVYRARQARTERLCLLTIFHLDPDAGPWAAFRREMEQLNQLRHPSMLEVLDLGEAHDGTPYLVTEWVEGEDLGVRLRQRGALTLPEALAVARQVGAALHAGHGIGVLHRDVRPDHIHILGEDEGFLRVKLGRVGVARLLEHSAGDLALVGSPEHMAPEQVLGHPLEVDSRADQYALAVVLYQALTTSRPFRGDSVGATLVRVIRGEAEPLRALRPDVPASVEYALARAMARDREVRFPDMQAFVQALQEGIPLPMGLAELTEPWLSPPADLEAARRLVLATGAEPAAPLSRGLSSALEEVVRSGPLRLGSLAAQEPEEEPSAGAVPEEMDTAATVPHSMQEVMQLAVPPAPDAVPAEADATAPMTAAPMLPPGEESDSVTSLEIVAEYGVDGRPLPLSGERVVRVLPEAPQPALPSVIVDLPTRSVEGERLPQGVAAPNDPTQMSPHQRADGGQSVPAGQRLLALLERRATLAERLAWAVAGACVGGLLMHLLS
ncbi:MAG: protein kinase [Myxococcales bacterium]|nr:protein kinase [Myxococcota bacterium]MDW8283667.1 protein kinase [Myxococcales bacterium]